MWGNSVILKLDLSVILEHRTIGSPYSLPNGIMVVMMFNEYHFFHSGTFNDWSIQNIICKLYDWLHVHKESWLKCESEAEFVMMLCIRENCKNYVV